MRNWNEVYFSSIMLWLPVQVGMRDAIGLALVFYYVRLCEVLSETFPHCQGSRSKLNN